MRIASPLETSLFHAYRARGRFTDEGSGECVKTARDSIVVARSWASRIDDDDGGTGAPGGRGGHDNAHDCVVVSESFGEDYQR